jgi:hypothetical protein
LLHSILAGSQNSTDLTDQTLFFLLFCQNISGSTVQHTLSITDLYIIKYIAGPRLSSFRFLCSLFVNNTRCG